MLFLILNLLFWLYIRQPQEGENVILSCQFKIQYLNYYYYHYWQIWDSCRLWKICCCFFFCLGALFLRFFNNISKIIIRWSVIERFITFEKIRAKNTIIYYLTNYKWWKRLRKYIIIATPKITFLKIFYNKNFIYLLF